MNKCVICNTSQAIVHSGRDALVMRVSKMVGRVCYPCANKQAQEAQASYAKQMEWYKSIYKERKIA